MNTSLLMTRSRVLGIQPFPVPLPGMVAWFDASDANSVTSDANGVSAFANKAHNATFSQVTQAVDANKPNITAAQFNGRDGMRYLIAGNESVDLLGTAPLTAAPIFILVVMGVENNGGTRAVLELGDQADINERFTLQVNPGAGDLVEWISRTGGVNQTAQTTAAYTPGTNTLHIVRVEEIASNNRRVLLDGGGVGTNAVASVPAGVDSIDIGGNVSVAGGVFDGWINEVVICNEIPGASLIAAAEAHLKVKWGTA